MKPFLTLLLLVISSLSYGRETIELDYLNTINFNQPFKADFIAQKQLEVLKKHKILRRGKPLYIVLNTPGGSVTAGNQFIDFLKSLNRPVHTITIQAASMGYHTVQQLGTRYIIPHGMLMSHRASLGGMGGQIPGELFSRLAYIKSMIDEMNQDVANRLGVTLKSYEAMIHDEMWLTAKQAVERNNADKIVNVVCGISLMGTEKSSVNTIFGPVGVVRSSCPLITAPIGVDFGDKLSKKQKFG